MGDVDDASLLGGVHDDVDVDGVAVGVYAQGDARAGSVDEVCFGNVGYGLENVDVGNLGHMVEGDNARTVGVRQDGDAPRGPISRGQARCGFPAVREICKADLCEPFLVGAGIFHGAAAPQGEPIAARCVFQNDVGALHVAYMGAFERSQPTGDLLA